MPKDNDTSSTRKRRAATRRDLLRTAAAGVVAGAASRVLPQRSAAQGEAERAPNILLVFPDQHRHDALGVAGNEAITTPTLDRLAREGTRFSNLWVQSPVCRPSRASLLTGHYPHAHGVTHNRARDFDPSWPSFLHNLQDAGYETAWIGKSHFVMGGWDTLPSDPEEGMDFDARTQHEDLRAFGLDHVIEEGGQWYPAIEGFRSDYTEYLRQQGLWEAYRRETVAVWRTTEDKWKPLVSELPAEADVTAYLARRSVDWLHGRDGARPFFLAYAPVKPHVPLVADSRWSRHYAEIDVPGGPRERVRPTSEAWGRWLEAAYRQSPKDDSEEYFRRAKRIYYAMVSMVDENVGRILEALESLGELDRTWVIYSSDHGDMMGDFRLMGKSLFHHGAVGVPALVRPPGKVPVRQVIEAPVETIDLTATMLDVAGAEPLWGTRGVSLLAAMEGAEVDKPCAFSEIQRNAGSPYYFGVTDGEHRYTVDVLSGVPAELFDLRRDPDERVNLVDDPAHAKTVRRMQERFVEPHLAGADVQQFSGR